MGSDIDAYFQSITLRVPRIFAIKVTDFSHYFEFYSHIFEIKIVI